jgi:CRP-like cAMP-binding protein
MTSLVLDGEAHPCFSLQEASPVQQIAAFRENLLLSTLDENCYSRLNPQVVPLTSGETLYDMDASVSHVYFPAQGTMVSLIAETEDGDSAEVGITGYEGLVPISPVLELELCPHRALIQIPGSAVRITTSAFLELMDCDASFRRATRRYSAALLCQISQTALCNALHEVGQRLARWLLFSQDRVDRSDLPLTHEFLSRMLATNRATVSLNAELLKKSGIIAYSRGKIQVVDRKALEAVSCPCYAQVKKRYSELGF